MTESLPGQEKDPFTDISDGFFFFFVLFCFVFLALSAAPRGKNSLKSLISWEEVLVEEQHSQGFPATSAGR